MSRVLVNVTNSNGRRDSIDLDTDLYLSDIRIILTQRNLMNNNDAFIHANKCVDKFYETLIALKPMLTSNTLNIGYPVAIDVSFFDMNNYQKSEFLGKKNINVFSGLTLTDDGLTPTNKKLFRFAENYVPSAKNADAMIDKEGFYTFTIESRSMQRRGVDYTNLALNTPWTSALANFEYAKNKHQSKKTVNSYFTTRFTSNKIHLITDQTQLIIEEDFAQELKNAVTGHEYSITGYRNLVALLNQYGWYIPTEYTLGGAIYSTKQSAVGSLGAAGSESHSFDATAVAKFHSFDSSAGDSDDTTHTSTSMQERILQRNNRSESIIALNPSIAFYEVDGNTSDPVDIVAWRESLKDAKNWRIVRYTSFMPSLMLLNHVDNPTLSTCLRLLTQFNSYLEVKSLQQYINIQEYENRMAYVLNPRYGNK